MKKIILIAFLIILYSCVEKPNPNSFTNCDEINFYCLDNLAENTLITNDTKNKALFNILFEESSLELGNIEIQNALNTFFIKKIIDKSENVKISSLFYDTKMKTQNASFSFSSVVCAPFYRDILIFKKNNKVVAVAKICFDCNQNLLTTENGKTLDSPLDYNKLKEYLKK